MSLKIMSNQFHKLPHFVAVFSRLSSPSLENVLFPWNYKVVTLLSNQTIYLIFDFLMSIVSFCFEMVKLEVWLLSSSCKLSPAFVYFILLNLFIFNFNSDWKQTIFFLFQMEVASPTGKCIMTYSVLHP